MISSDGPCPNILEGDSAATAARDLPDHIIPCTCDNHTGICCECRARVTVSPSSDREYGHAKSRRDRNDGGGRCSHRPVGCDFGGPQSRTWNTEESA